jgi:formylglycine-generating enzyme required for sulfatase activity
MIPVEYSEGNFLLAETELTRELYVAIVGSGYSTNLQQPAYEYYSDFSTFFSKLNALTELNFRFPTYNEWLFAAKGGNKSQNYTYSGSNIIANVAWYSGNSDGSYHDVKQLQPNELGFYDMSGNAAEFVLLGSSPNNTSRYFYMGGSYSSNETACKSTSYDFDTYSYQRGVRIAFTNN